jgi:hypothetical protein
MVIASACSRRPRMPTPTSAYYPRLAHRAGGAEVLLVSAVTLNFPLLWLATVVLATGAGGRITPIMQSLLALSFLVGNLLFMYSSWRLPRGRDALLFAAGAAVPLAVALAQVWPAARVAPAFVAAIIVGAAVEEIVFRSVFPRRLAALLPVREAALAGAVAAQGVFALCHAVPGLVTAGRIPTLSDLLRYAAAGLVLYALRLLLGLGAAVGAHAALNLFILLGAALPPPAPSTPVAGLLFVGGLVLVWAVTRLSRGDIRRILSHLLLGKDRTMRRLPAAVALIAALGAAACTGS